MHSILFSVKRAFHKSTWYGRDLLDPIRLTPSRFDILYILQRHQFPMWQSKIRKILDIAGPTLSIMLKALEHLGFVARRGSNNDRRQIEVSLTRVGRIVLRAALELFVDSGVVHDDISFFLCTNLSSRDPGILFEDVARMDDHLRLLRRRLGDRASLAYRWHPDD